MKRNNAEIKWRKTEETYKAAFTTGHIVLYAHLYERMNIRMF